jgi:hypothetical protein
VRPNLDVVCEKNYAGTPYREILLQNCAHLPKVRVRVRSDMTTCAPLFCHNNKLVITSTKEEIDDWSGSPLDLLARLSLHSPNPNEDGYYARMSVHFEYARPVRGYDCYHRDKSCPSNLSSHHFMLTTEAQTASWPPYGRPRRWFGPLL